MSASALAKAQAAWGRPPDWVAALAEACDGHTLRQTAKRIGISPAMISLAINNRRENWDFIKSKVENTLMVTMMACPVQGLISSYQCAQEQAAPFSTANPLRIQQYKACRNGCQHFKGDPK